MRLGALGAAYARFAFDSPGYFEVMWRPALLDPDALEAHGASRAAMELLRAEVARCQDAGLARGLDPRALTTTLWSVRHGCVVLWRDGPLAEEEPGRDPEDVVREQIGLVLGLLDAPAQIVDPIARSRGSV